jgi:hypothetical protein
MRGRLLLVSSLALAGCARGPAPTAPVAPALTCAPARGPVTWPLARAATAPVTLCVPPRFHATRSPGVWAAPGRHDFVARILVETRAWPQPPTLALSTVEVRRGAGCADCYTLREGRDWTDTVQGRPVRLELARVSGGYEHQHDVPSGRLLWERAPGQWVVVTVADPTDHDLTMAWAVLRSVRFEGE